MEDSELVKLKTSIKFSKHRKILIQRINAQMKVKSGVICPVLNRRRVLLTKFLEINKTYRANLNRFQAFSVALELIKVANLVTKNSKFKSSYELKGLTKDGKLIVAHIREEQTIKGRQLYLISCYWKQKS